MLTAGPGSAVAGTFPADTLDLSSHDEVVTAAQVLSVQASADNLPTIVKGQAGRAPANVITGFGACRMKGMDRSQLGQRALRPDIDLFHRFHGFTATQGGQKQGDGQ